MCSWSWTPNVGLDIFWFWLKVKSNQNHFEFDAIGDYISNPSWIQVTGKSDMQIFSAFIPLCDNNVERIGTQTRAPVVTTPFHVDPESLKLMSNQP